MSRGLVLALLTVGCLREPTYNGPRDADTDGNEQYVPSCANPNDVAVLPNGTGDVGARACGPGYEMVFADTGAKMPYQLGVGSSQLMANGQTCNDERGTGIGIFPSTLVNAEQRPGVTGTLTRVWTGPVVGRVRVDWEASYTCSGPGTVQDYSIFTFFPNGHITRFDRIRMPVNVTTGSCTVCSGGAGSPSSTQFLTSYATLQAPDNAALTGGSIGSLTAYGDQIPNVPAACLDTLGRSVAFGFENTSTRVRVAGGGTPRAFAFVQDIAVGTTIGMIDDHFTTHMMVSAVPACATLYQTMLDWRVRPELEIQGVGMGPANDGIYGGENDSGATAIQTTVGVFTIRAVTGNTIPAGAAVWIDFGSQNTANIAVSSNRSPTGEWFRLQRVTASQIVFYFRDPIAQGDIITITPG